MYACIFTGHVSLVYKWDPFHYHWLTSISTKMNFHFHFKMWDKIPYSFYARCIFEVWEWMKIDIFGVIELASLFEIHLAISHIIDESPTGLYSASGLAYPHGSNQHPALAGAWPWSRTDSEWHGVFKGPVDGKWRQRYGSTLAKVMACWLTAPSHYKTNVDLPSVRSIGIHLSTILQEILQPSVNKISWKITLRKFLWNLPGANQLTLESHGTADYDGSIIG